MEKRGWHNPKKFVKKSTEGYCNQCHKNVESLEAHNRTKHKKAKS